jgi:hypothetical protein
MPHYKVMINGRNFLVEMDGRVAKYGFYTFRFVEAADPTAAEYAAVQMIRETQRLRGLIRNASEDPPVMDVTSIDEVETLPPLEEREPGFVWYEENPRRWWQFWRR